MLLVHVHSVPPPRPPIVEEDTDAPSSVFRFTGWSFLVDNDSGGAMSVTNLTFELPREAVVRYVFRLAASPCAAEQESEQATDISVDIDLLPTFA